MNNAITHESWLNLFNRKLSEVSRPNRPCYNESKWNLLKVSIKAMRACLAVACVWRHDWWLVAIHLMNELRCLVTRQEICWEVASHPSLAEYSHVAMLIVLRSEGQFGWISAWCNLRLRWQPEFKGRSW